MVRSMPDPLVDTSLSRLKIALGESRGTILWPLDWCNSEIAENFLQQGVELVRGSSDATTFIFGENLTQSSIIEFFNGSSETAIQHMLLNREQIFQTSCFEQPLPLSSIANVILTLISNRGWRSVDDSVGQSISPRCLTSEKSEADQFLLEGAIARAKYLFREQQERTGKNK